MVVDLYRILVLAEEANLQTWLKDTISTIAGILIVLGILGGIAGIIIYIAVGILEIQLFTGMFSSSGMRKIMHSLYAMIIIPVTIGILFILNSLAVNGYLGPRDEGSIAWMIEHIWRTIINWITSALGWT